VKKDQSNKEAIEETSSAQKALSISPYPCLSLFSCPALSSLVLPFFARNDESFLLILVLLECDSLLAM
jgi:hypothetical protein